MASKDREGKSQSSNAAGKRREKLNHRQQPQTGSQPKPDCLDRKSYTVNRIVPVKNGDVVTVAKAVHRRQFGRRVKELFDPERKAAVKAIETGVYIGWRCPEYSWDCFRVEDASKCFCGHRLSDHTPYTGTSVQVPCTAPSCECKAFEFIPSRPEEVGEFWLRKRPGFDAESWRAACRCKHTHEEHAPGVGHACRRRGCRCAYFESSFLCASCDKHWEEHQTFFDTEDSRKKRN
ncbi:protein FAM221B-like [Megalops cyprinoides]|uniref:protein FAM221B-like n=1 Tax=Megalops cyprinoides TaxID=118141 RepID=UPI0018644F33|nr:protein FAM221B-like [Megalops cyprinoides]